jgi:hypothetical protein
MGTPFAAIETALNSGALAALANATLTWGGHRADGLFVANPSDPLGIGNSRPEFRCMATALPDIAQAASISLDYQGTATAYSVRVVEPDGSGMLRLVLEKA